MRIPGIVDVYQVGKDWVARSWPKVQNQPNSAAQLLWRKKFKDAHTLIKTWTGAYMVAWQAIECPTGKMWIDIAMTSILTNLYWFSSVPPLYSCSASLRYYKDGDWFMPPGYYFGGKIPPSEPIGYFESHPPHHVHPPGGIIKWNNKGWICPTGKRPKIKWFPSLFGPLIKIIHSYQRTTVKGTWHYLLLDDCPNGCIWSGLETWIPAGKTENKWVIYGPPIKFLPTPMTEDWL